MLPAWPSDSGSAADLLTPTHPQKTHRKAQLGDVQVELVRIEVNEVEQCLKYHRPPLTALAEHARFFQGAMQTVTQITQVVHRAHRVAWYCRKVVSEREKIISRLGQNVKHSQSKQTSQNENTYLFVLASVRPYKYSLVMFFVCTGMSA